ncbi:hypothetical protein HWV62_32890 [Athelia sp. TMB]|nr:hypothetical protein HWV62_32890 [Athelia sp. TMB]
MGTYMYFVMYPKDKLGLKLLVTGLVQNDHFLQTPWSLYSSLGVNIVVAVIVQIFYTVRIFKISDPSIRWWISGLIFLVFPASYMSNALDFIYGNRIKTSTSAEVSAGTLPAAPRARPQNSSFIQMGTMPVQSDIYDDSGFEGRGSAGSKFENNRLKEGSGDESVIRIDGAV